MLYDRGFTFSRHCIPRAPTHSFLSLQGTEAATFKSVVFYLLPTPRQSYRGNGTRVALESRRIRSRVHCTYVRIQGCWYARVTLAHVQQIYACAARTA